MIKNKEDFFDLSSIVVLDVETDGLRDYTKVHFAVTTDMEGNERVFEKPTSKVSERVALKDHLASFRTVVGHNIIGFDFRAISDLLPGTLDGRENDILDTLVVSRLLNYSLDGGHSLENWGNRVGVKKVGTDITDWSTATPQMLERCISDVRVNKKILERMMRFLQDPEWQQAILIEHYVSWMCEEMSKTGLPFDADSARNLQTRLYDFLEPMDERIMKAFPPKLKLWKRVQPKVTKAGTLGSAQFRFLEKEEEYVIRQAGREFSITGGAIYPDLSCFSSDPFDVFVYDAFNPGSPRQIVERLNEAGWKPTEKTKGHIEALKDKSTPKEKLDEYKLYGWKVSEENLKTLPATAPQAAFDLAKRITIASRLSDLEEWLALVGVDGRIHPRFQSIGAWTQRLSHSSPNSANIPVAKRSPKDNDFEKFVNDINDEMRALFIAEKRKRLVGTDADGIQMRIFAHLVGDERLIKALIEGRKEDGTDIHSLHKGALGDVCKSRDAAKTFIYAFLLGAGVGKVAEILECSFGEAKTAVGSFLEFYPGLKELKQSVIPRDADRGYFIGLDGRKVACDSEHLMLAGYLQNGEKVIMSYAARDWRRKFAEDKIDYQLLNWVHDEWQTMIDDDPELCEYVQKVQIQSIRDQGDNLNMLCPLEGSSDWGYSWKETH